MAPPWVHFAERGGRRFDDDLPAGMAFGPFIRQWHRRSFVLGASFALGLGDDYWWRVREVRFLESRFENASICGGSSTLSRILGGHQTPGGFSERAGHLAPCSAGFLSVCC